MRKFVRILMILSALTLIGFAAWIYTHPEEEGSERQAIEESLADAYIEHLLDSSHNRMSPGETARAEYNYNEETAPEIQESDEESLPEETVEPGTDETIMASESDTDAESESETEAETEKREVGTWVDENYYTRGGTTFTPEYATGQIIGVLEIPTAKIRRGVYGGTWEDIWHDLDIWMVTVARPDYVLGETHYAIYGHNHTVQDLSFNRLKDVKVGDVYTYTTEDGVYIYDVTDFFADWRESVAVDYVDNFNRPADEMYILTCGRNEYRYKDIVVVGTMRCVVPIEDYAKNPDYYMYEYMAEEETEEDTSEEESETETETDETETVIATEPEAEDSSEETTQEETTEKETEKQEPGILTVRVENAGDDKSIAVSYRNEDGTAIPATLALMNEDGLSVERWTQEAGMSDDHIIKGLQENSIYIAAVMSRNSGGEIPEEYVFTYKVGGSIKEGDGQENLTEDGTPVWVKPAMIALAGMILILLSLLLTPSKKQKR